MTITNCPRCGSMNITTAGTCANCGWSQFAQVTVSSGVYKTIGEIEIKETGKALLEDYKRLLLENRNLKECVAELEAEQARWVMVSERLPKESGWYLAGLIGWAGGYYTGEVHFDTETGLPWRSSVRDEVYCWLDGVPELPQPPEVQE